MKRRNAALISIGSILGTPLACLSAGVVTSCSNIAPDDAGIYVSTKDVEVNHNSGIGEFDLTLDEQPVDNKVYVYVITAEGPHHMELLAPDERVYHGHPAILYDMYNGVTKVRMGFTEFVGETTKTVVSIEVRYNNRRGEWVLKHVNGINLTVTYTQNPIEEVHLFSLNDLHGVAEGYGEDKDYYPATNVKDAGLIRIADEIGPVIDSHPGSFIVTAGDNNSGDMFSTALHGQSIFEVLKAMGARYSAVGNHAFEWGLEPLASYQFDDWARTDDTMGNYFLASNIINGKDHDDGYWETNPAYPEFKTDYAYWKTQRVAWADPYKLVNMNGHLVCLIGLTTQSTPQDGNKAVVDNLSFINYNYAVDYSIYNCREESGDQLFNSIESFILLTHVECEQDETTGKAQGDAINIAKTLKHDKVDAIISGHSHKVVDASVINGYTGRPILVSQAETEGRRYTDITLRFDNTKPVGEKKIAVEQEVHDMGLWKRYPDGDTDENYNDAKNELIQIKANPKSPLTTAVASAFNIWTSQLSTALGEQIGNAKRRDSLLHPAIHWSDGGIGHGYYIDEKGFKPDPKLDPEGKYNEQGHIINQLGAWICYAQLLGFSSLYGKDIRESARGLTYPAICLINMDSMKVEYTTPKGGEEPVTLKDMYALQTYENTTKFGYISIWQLANVINHSLAGEGIFNYSAPKENYYVPENEIGIDPTPANSLNNLSQYNYGTGASDHVTTAYPSEFKNQGTYKKLDNTYCLYNCGPIQGYGFRFKVKPAVPGNPGALDETTHRRWVLDNITNANGETYPAIWVMDPTISDTPYETIRQPESWLSAETIVKDPHIQGMIPMITNNFLYDGANWETPMVQVYMKHNEGEDWRSYPVMSFSTISRDLMIEFCNMSSSSLPFDMPISIVKQLVEYPS